MSEYSALNIRESIALDYDKKYIVKENSIIDWDIKTLIAYFESVKQKKSKGDSDSQILPSSPETFALS